ncbi:uncharacterized protein HMPREF1541_06837 [Cyphellophora europaea CBS 101466]|uniref:NAD(P)-binding protein n=1 Tax=Cyphellophora europaea (strain CBS 101466) TaxID=1220924 RepID=W2RSS9_CYPE1|nr:uncharacterized protein HMPREF1541_06837 [Cyphellophora europaea CBS 101466]ETN38798.1 hypothetical protein HMPREF1541_06837 [Cyphellophora europaea CBS 101466]
MALYKIREFFWQSFFIAEPPLTEHNLWDQSGRVCIVTGGYTGVGLEVASILYQHNATVYIAGRSEDKATKAINSIADQFPASGGKLYFLKVDLSDLATIKPAVKEFERRESKLHWLNNNAGVMRAPTESRGAQGMNIQFQTNIYGPFLLTKLLSPILERTAANEEPGSVRATWAGSLGTILCPFEGGVEWTADEAELAGEGDPDKAYHVTKAANYLLGVEFGKRVGDKGGVMHLTYNPGNLKTELARHLEPSDPVLRVARFLVYPARMGAYTEIYAGLSKVLSPRENQGGWVVPWGRSTAPMRPDIKAEVEKEKGTAFRLYEWCDRITKQWQ